MEHDTQQLLIRFRAGDSDAAEQLFRRYVDRLVGLARSRLSSGMKQRVGAEDVVQSVYRSFFARARDGQFELQRSGDLWRLLSAITINKVLKKVEHHRQQRRDYRQETAIEQDSGFAPSAELFAIEPTDQDAVAVIDELHDIMAQLPEKQRSMLELRLQDQSTFEIAEKLGCSERTVRRFLKNIEGEVADRLVTIAD